MIRGFYLCVVVIARWNHSRVLVRPYLASPERSRGAVVGHVVVLFCVVEPTPPSRDVEAEAEVNIF